MRSCALLGVRQWLGPRLLTCSDLHHGPAPHDGVLLTFNPARLGQVQARLNVLVRCLAPSFFRYPAAQRSASPELALLHEGMPRAPSPQTPLDGASHAGQRPHPLPPCPPRSSADEAARLYARQALVLNVHLNHDLSHRFFEVMAAGTAQVVFADPSLVGPLQHLAERPDVFQLLN